MKKIKRFHQFSILEKTIGIENIRSKWYSDIDKKTFYKIVNIDPTSVRKKDFSKPGKYTKWLFREYKKGNLKLNEIDNLEYRNKINYYLFIFSTGWFKSNQKKILQKQKAEDPDRWERMRNSFDYRIDDVDILKYDLKNFLDTLKHYVEDFEFITNDAKFDVVYFDNLIDILIPINYAASYQTAKNTEWCSQSKIGFSMWKNNSILFRIIPKDKTYDKLKLTWQKPRDGYDTKWFIACSKYPEINGEGSPFEIINGKENWLLKKLKWDDIYGEKSGIQDRWIENSKNIEKTMELVSKKAKDHIVKYYNHIIKNNK